MVTLHDETALWLRDLLRTIAADEFVFGLVDEDRLGECFDLLDSQLNRRDVPMEILEDLPGRTLSPAAEALRRAFTRPQQGGVIDEKLRADSERIDVLESLLWIGKVGNGVAIFPSTGLLDRRKYINIIGLGDEDGSHLGDEITGSCGSLREAIDDLRAALNEEGDGDA